MTNGESAEGIEAQRAYDMIYRDSVTHIASMKERQWKITHYALLLLAVLFSVSARDAPVSEAGKVFVTVGAVGVVVIWLVVTYGIIKSLSEKRGRLLRLYERFDDQARAVYGEGNPDRDKPWYDSTVTTSLGIVVLVGAVIVCVNAFAHLIKL